MLKNLLGTTKDSFKVGKSGLKINLNTLTSGVDDGDIIITPNGSGDLVLGGLSGSGTRMVVVDGSGTTSTQAISGGTSDHGSLTGLGDDDHTQYHNDTRGDARYYTQSQLDGGELNSLYYTETETDSLLSGKANSSHSHALVDITGIGDMAEENDAPSNGSDYIRRNGNWELADYFDGAYSSLSGVPSTFNPSAHTHAASDITSGTFASARISEASVTQHESALSITESQISDLDHFSGDYTDLTNVPWNFNGTDIYKVNSGNVGIGTSSPNALLEVAGVAFFQGLHVISPSDADVGILRSIDSSGANVGQLAAVGLNGAGGAADWAFQASIADIRFLNTGDVSVEGGNLGVGVSSPATKLEVLSGLVSGTTATFRGFSGARGLELKNHNENSVTDSLWTFNHTQSNGRIAFALDGTERMRIHADGNVGIGTTSPEGTLHVAYADSYSTAFVVDRNENNEQAIKSWCDATANWTRSYGAKSYIITNEESGYDIRLRTADHGNVLTVDGGKGNVGIGTDNPTAAFHVHRTGVTLTEPLTRLQSDGALLFMDYNGTGRNYIDGTDKLYLREHPGVNRVVIDYATGNVQVIDLAGTGTRSVVADSGGNLSADGTPVFRCAFNDVASATGPTTLATPGINRGGFSVNTDGAYEVVEVPTDGLYRVSVTLTGDGVGGSDRSQGTAQLLLNGVGHGPSTVASYFGRGVAGVDRGSMVIEDILDLSAGDEIGVVCYITGQTSGSGSIEGAESRICIEFVP